MVNHIWLTHWHDVQSPISTKDRVQQLKRVFWSAAGKDWPMEADVGQLSNESRSVFLCTLAIDGLTGFPLAVHSLTDSRTTEKGHISESSHPDQLTCAKLVEATWRTILPTISKLLGATHSDVLVTQLLQVPLLLSLSLTISLSTTLA